MDLLYPLTDLIVSKDCVLDGIFNLSLSLSNNQGLLTFLMDANMSTEATPEPQIIKDFSVRQVLSEMRNIENITCDTLLSNGQRVGEFLLDQWIKKESNRKK